MTTLTEARAAPAAPAAPDLPLERAVPMALPRDVSISLSAE